MKLLYLFEELNRLGTTIVIATHDQEIIEQFDRPVLRMENGHVHQSLDGLRSSLSSMPENPL
jgi:cell division transport system ATP-binding protein